MISALCLAQFCGGTRKLMVWRRWLGIRRPGGEAVGYAFPTFLVADSFSGQPLDNGLPRIL